MQSVMAYFKILFFLHFGKYLGFMFYVIGSLGFVANKISLLFREQGLCLLQLSVWNTFLILYAYWSPTFSQIFLKNIALLTLPLYFSLSSLLSFISLSDIVPAFFMQAGNIISSCFLCSLIFSLTRPKDFVVWMQRRCNATGNMRAWENDGGLKKWLLQ